MFKNYTSTIRTCYGGYITQAIINNLAPLLFSIFQNDFGISAEQLGLLVTVNFSIQILVDFLAIKFVDKIGYRVCLITAMILSIIGLQGLGSFPYLFHDRYIGLLLAVSLYAAGGGIIEVLISPIVEACPLPKEKKASAMSLLHSFYCWGHVAVVLFSTLFFSVAGIRNWKYLTILWCIVPLLIAIAFIKVPIKTLNDSDIGFSLKKLLSIKLFWFFLILMICSGASELAISQWSSFFAEHGLEIPKITGDLLGPCIFAVLMGLTRVFYGKFGTKINLINFIAVSSAFCVLCYAVTAFSPFPVLSLIACALCGLAVGIMWPGVFSLSAKYIPKGGTAMFAFLALAGDLGCAAGPGIVGVVSQEGSNTLKTGIMTAGIFPLVLTVFVVILKKRNTLK